MHARSHGRFARRQPARRRHRPTADPLSTPIERVRQARQLLHEASDRLTLTRQEAERDPRIARVRRARELLDVEVHRLAQTRQQVEEDQPQNAAVLATDD